MQLATYENVNDYKCNLFLTHTDLSDCFPPKHMHGFIFYLGLYIVCALFRHLTGIVRCPGMFAMQIFDFKNSLAIEIAYFIIIIIIIIIIWG